MNRKLLSRFLGFFFMAFAATAVMADDRREVEAFVAQFKQAVNNKDIESILAMNAWTGLPDWQRKGIETSFSQITQQGLLNIKVEYIQDGESIEFHKKDKVFVPNLPPVAKIYVEINTDKDFRGGYSYYIGRDIDALRFSHVVLKENLP